MSEDENKQPQNWVMSTSHSVNYGSSIGSGKSFQSSTHTVSMGKGHSIARGATRGGGHSTTTHSYHDETTTHTSRTTTYGVSRHADGSTSNISKSRTEGRSWSESKTWGKSKRE